MAASFRPRVPATTDEHAFRDTGMMFAADATRACTHKSRRADQARLVSAMASTAALKRTSLVVRVGPRHKVAALQPAAREQEPRGS
jgi:hypothetical protein